MPTSKYVLLCFFLLGHSRWKNEACADEEEGNKMGAEYLRDVMSRLRSEMSEDQTMELTEMTHSDDMDKTASTAKILGPTPLPQLQAEIFPSPSVSIPPVPPGLTAEELTAIYNAAVTKVVNLPQLAGAAPAELQPHTSPGANTVKPAAHGPAGSLSGYYYYYYPIKSFLKTSAAPVQTPKVPVTTTTPKPVHMTVTMTDATNKGVEPLFMAISSFIGMALLFAFSVLFTPKFGKLRSGGLQKDKATTQDLIALARVVFDQLEGKDCAERLACEIGHLLKTAKLNDKPLRVLEIVLPQKYGSQITLVRKAAARKNKCRLIPCKVAKPAKSKEKPKPWRKSATPHDLWMKHFDNRTRFRQPENIWNKNPHRTD